MGRFKRLPGLEQDDALLLERTPLEIAVAALEDLARPVERLLDRLLRGLHLLGRRLDRNGLLVVLVRLAPQLARAGLADRRLELRERDPDLDVARPAQQVLVESASVVEFGLVVLEVDEAARSASSGRRATHDFQTSSGMSSEG